MEHLEQENRELKNDIAWLSSMMEFVLTAQNQSSPTPATHPQWTVISEVATSAIPVAATQSGPTMPAGFPWGMPPNFMPEGFAPTFASMPVSSPIMFMPPPIVHTLPRVEDTIYHSESSEGPNVFEKMDKMKDQFLELHKELKTLRGTNMFGKSAAELCLVPNIKIPMKFEVPDFEKYKGNTYSLTGAALRWYMGLDSTSVRTFNNLGEAFVKQYKYNMDMAPDRDHQSAPIDFTEMVNMGMRLEEGVREGLLKNLLQPRNIPQIPEPLPWWYKPELCCAFHQGALGHDIENCYPLKYEVQKLVKSGMVSFEDRASNVKFNMLPSHGNASVNMIDDCPRGYKVYDVRHIR
ncbi:hypothetical protein KIW84_054513 [Lathyrus oleraceus]|uniref:Retrotransposon gag domain-containing protein n=1 Tax=Pisum sativum TaxID=3888 RepID=A0A9D4WTA1_PEA|nr:hypothetical protein KIW84_054513 [Pisum sativum]